MLNHKHNKRFTGLLLGILLLGVACAAPKPTVPRRMLAGTLSLPNEAFLKFAEQTKPDMVIMGAFGVVQDTAHWLILGGLCAFAASAMLMTGAHTDTPFWNFALWLVIGRIGLAFVIPTINATALHSLPSHLVSQGSGAVGMNMITVSLEHRTAIFSQALAGAQTPDNVLTQDLMQGLSGLLSQLDWPVGLHPVAAL